MNKALVLTALAAGLVGTSAATFADSYLGASVGYADYDISLSDIDDGSVLTSSSVDDDDVTWRLFIGYAFNEYFALEGGYTDFGNFGVSAVSDGTGSFWASGPVTSDADADGIEVSVVASLPITDAFSVYGRLGVFSWDAKTTLTDDDGSVSVKTDDEDPVYGVGVHYRFSEVTSVRGEYARYELDDLDVDTWNVGLVFGF